MKGRVVWALAKGVVLESIRRKDLWVVAILGMLIVAAAGALGFFGLNGLEAFAKDLAVTVLGLFSSVAAVLVSSRMLPEEIRQRTLYPLLARPVTRLELLVGKLAGAVLVTWIGFFLLIALTTGVLALFGVTFGATFVQYALLKMVGLAVLCAVSLALSTWMTPQGAATLSLVLAFGTGLVSRGLVMAYEGAGPAVQPIFKLVNAILPQYALFDLGARVANDGWGLVPLWVVAALVGYALIYSAAALGLAWARFARQAL
ncbi:MAG: ABC transporter permease [Fimbriimonadaceae bacterium]|nr:ABC transporter permease [Chthonomonadaceae bacterium]MCO5295899.1 ABC transporter permease [Fimbriimonadaceae bacterium]